MPGKNPPDDPTDTALSLRLPNTEAGQQWLSQFAEDDHDMAARLLGSLTLVSHSAFERTVASQILEHASRVDGPVGLYAVREVDADSSYFGSREDEKANRPLDAVGRGADLGSEARVAALIRNLAKGHPRKLFNHPPLEVLRETRTRAIFVVDDFIGSGKRAAEFILSMWRSPTITSWHSRHEVQFVAIAYSGTDQGIRKVRGLRSNPEVVIERDCPTLDNLPWRDDVREAIVSLCRRYGGRTSRPRMRLGFRGTMAALVFEHGCPNNVPAVLWAPRAAGDWNPLFPDRAVLPAHASAFPADITLRDPIEIILELDPDGHDQSARPVITAAPLGVPAVTVLALVARGIRSRAALSYATGLSAQECTSLLDNCTRRGYLTASVRLTPAGRSELAQALHATPGQFRVPPIGEDGYHPTQLRGPPES